MNFSGTDYCSGCYFRHTKSPREHHRSLFQSWGISLWLVIPTRFLSDRSTGMSPVSSRWECYHPKPLSKHRKSLVKPLVVAVDLDAVGVSVRSMKVEVSDSVNVGALALGGGDGSRVIVDPPGDGVLFILASKLHFSICTRFGAMNPGPKISSGSSGPSFSRRCFVPQWICCIS